MGTENLSELDTSNYPFGADVAYSQSYILPVVTGVLEAHPHKRIFELGCGNGTNAHALARLGYSITGIDPSTGGVEIARSVPSNCHFEQGSAYDDLAAKYGTFPVVLSLEVVEHLFYPKRYASTVASLLEPGGIAIISTPYHGYLKNLVLSLLNKWDTHLDPFWDYGHIKFWSVKTFSALLSRAGLRVVGVHRAGRIPQLAKSMVLVAQKPPV